MAQPENRDEHSLVFHTRQQYGPATLPLGTYRLVQRTRVVVPAEGVLLQVVLPDDLGDLQSDLLVLSQRVTTNGLHDLGQRILVPEDLTRAAGEHTKGNREWRGPRGLIEERGHNWLV